MLKRIAVALAMTIVALVLIDRASLVIPPCGPGGGGYSDQKRSDDDNCALREGIIVAGIERLREYPPEVWTALASLAIAIFTGTLWFSTDKLWRAGEKQIGIAIDGNKLTKEIFTAEHRPWISVDAELIQLRFDKGHAIIELKFRLKNFGNSPAGAVSAEATVSLLSGNTGNWTADRDAFRKAAAARTPRTADSFGGTVIFPNQEIEGGQTLSIMRADMDKSSFKTDDMKVIAVNVYVCASYRFTFEEGVHQTVTAFSLGTLPIPKVDCIYTRARLMRFGLGDYAD